MLQLDIDAALARHSVGTRNAKNNRWQRRGVAA